MSDDNLGGKFMSLYLKLKNDEEVSLPTKWSTNITPTEKNQLIAAATLLGVTFSDDVDSWIEEAKKKVALISTCRCEVNEFIDALEFQEMDTLVLGAETLTLKKKIQENPRKKIFTGTMNEKEVYVKIMKNANCIGISSCSICCNTNFRTILRNQKQLQRGYCLLEISIPGQVLNIKQRDLPLTKWELIIQLLSELYRLSKSKIIHNDIKPSNIVIVKLESGKYQAKLIDFELSKRFDTWDDDYVLDRGDLILSRCGTDFYNPPEKSGDEIITPKSDIYSMGKVLLEVLVGDVLPFTSILSKLTNPISKNRYFDPVHANLRELLVEMLKQTRSERPNIEKCFEILGVDPEKCVDDYDYQAYFQIRCDDINNKNKRKLEQVDGNKRKNREH